MAKQTPQRDKNEAVGIFVYHTDKYKNVYYDFLGKKYYVVFASEVSKFNMYSSKAILALLIGFACNYYLKIDALVSVAIGLCVYVVGYVLFRINVLSNLTEINDFVRPKKNYIDTLSNGLTLPKLIVMNVLLVLFIGLSYLNIVSQQYTGSNLILNYGLLAVGGVFLVLYLMALIKKLNK